MSLTLEELIQSYSDAIERGALDEAHDAVERAIAIAPGSAEAWGCRGEYFRFHARDLPVALACFERAGVLDPSSHLGPGCAAVVLEDMQELRQADAAWTEAIERSPWHPDLWRGRARLRDRQGEFEGALADLEEALRLAPAEVDAHCLRGEVLLRCARPQEALRAFDRAARVARGHGRAAAGRSFALGALGRIAEANAARPEGAHDPGELIELRWNELPLAPDRKPLLLRYRVREEHDPDALEAQAQVWLDAIGHAVPGEQIVIWCGWRLEVIDTPQGWVLGELDQDSGPWRAPVARYEVGPSLWAEAAAADLLDTLRVQGQQVDLLQWARMCPVALADPRELRMRRVPPVSDEDSGWRIGPVDPSTFLAATHPERYERWPPLGFLQEGRTDLLPFLTLPVGYEVVLRGGEVVSLRDEGGRERLAA